MLQNGLYVLRRRLSGPKARIDFPILEGFQARGGTDYYLRAIGFDIGVRSHETTGVICSFISDHPDGFGDDEIAALERLLPRLALALKGELTRQIAETVLDTYVGREAGARIMQGDIRRGSLAVVNAVILYADLRGFTHVTDSVPRDELAALMDAYFEAMVPPVIDHGGEVLKYLGDGMLATFRLDDAPDFSICGDALQAAHDMQSRIEGLNRTREAMRLPTMGLDVAMHMGEVLYGNVGAGDRLDFTVIGPAVNEASRIEQLCKELGHPILISQTFAGSARDCADRLIPVGTHTLRDIREAQALYTIELD